MIIILLMCTNLFKEIGGNRRIIQYKIRTVDQFAAVHLNTTARYVVFFNEWRQRSILDI